VPFCCQLARRGLERYPREPFLLAYRGLGHLHSGQYLKAMADFGEAFSLDPERYEWIFMRAKSVAQIESRADEALADFEAFVAKAEPDDKKVADAYYGMALCYLQRGPGYVAKAGELFRKGLESEKLSTPLFGTTNAEWFSQSEGCRVHASGFALSAAREQGRIRLERNSW
jgi:tetratricopeptide (TPR) repeat protein